MSDFIQEQTQEIDPKVTTKINALDLFKDNQSQSKLDTDPTASAHKEDLVDHLVMSDPYKQSFNPSGVADPAVPSFGWDANNPAASTVYPDLDKSLPKNASKEAGMSLDPVNGFIYQALHLQGAENSYGSPRQGVPVAQPIK